MVLGGHSPEHDLDVDFHAGHLHLGHTVSRVQVHVQLLRHKVQVDRGRGVDLKNIFNLSIQSVNVNKE